MFEQMWLADCDQQLVSYLRSVMLAAIILQDSKDLPMDTRSRHLTMDVWLASELSESMVEQVRPRSASLTV